MIQPEILYFILNRIRKKTQMIIKEVYRRIEQNRIQSLIMIWNNNPIDQAFPQEINSEEQSFENSKSNQIMLYIRCNKYGQGFQQQEDFEEDGVYNLISEEVQILNYLNPNQYEQDQQVIIQKVAQQSTTPMSIQQIVSIKKDNQNENLRTNKEYLIKKLKEQKVQKLKNQKLIEFDDTIKVLQVLDNFLEQKQQNQLDQVITKISNVQYTIDSQQYNEQDTIKIEKETIKIEMNIEQLKKKKFYEIDKVIAEISNVQYMINNQQYNQKDTKKIEKNFKQFKKKKFYDVNKFQPKRFLTNIYNIIASQLILQKKKICKQKLKECYFQLSKNWINLLDFTKTEKENKEIKKEIKYENKQLQNFLNLLRNNNNSEISENVKYFQNTHYGKYSFLEIALNLLQILKIQWNDDKIRDNIFELLKEVVLKKQHKYQSKRAINFNKQDIISLMYKKENNNEVVDEEVITEIQQLLEGPIIYPQEQKKKQS